jgi:hypothetical protein
MEPLKIDVEHSEDHVGKTQIDILSEKYKNDILQECQKYLEKEFMFKNATPFLMHVMNDNLNYMTQDTPYRASATFDLHKGQLELKPIMRYYK